MRIAVATPIHQQPSEKPPVSTRAGRRGGVCPKVAAAAENNQSRIQFTSQWNPNIEKIWLRQKRTQDKKTETAAKKKRAEELK